jgi:transcriptional regulator with XRE-family HTH domain
MARERQAPKMSRRTLGDRLNLTDSAIAAWESGRNIPDPRTLTSVERILRTDGLLQDIVECLVTGEKSQEYMGRWVHAESQATTLLWFSFDVVPGLLQTEDYAHAILRDEQRVSARLDRQRILAKEDPPVLVALIDESVLRRNVGGPQVMREQLSHLGEMAQRENVAIHVITMRTPISARYTGSFILASRNGEGEIGYVDDAISGSVVENVEEVTRLRQMFEILRAHAKDRDESFRLIKEAAESWT